MERKRNVRRLVRSIESLDLNVIGSYVCGKCNQPFTVKPPPPIEREAPAMFLQPHSLLFSHKNILQLNSLRHNSVCLKASALGNMFDLPMNTLHRYPQTTLEHLSQNPGSRPDSRLLLTYTLRSSKRCPQVMGPCPSQGREWFSLVQTKPLKAFKE